MLAAGLILILSSGCNNYTRYKVLTFFFTGVPPFEEEKKPWVNDRKMTEYTKEQKRRKVVKATRFSHGPYASGECYLCHETSATGGMRGFGKKEEAADSITKPGIIPGKLVAPLRELCAGCHVSKSPEKAYEDGLWVHGPVSAGFCTLCHGPHAGPNLYLLQKNEDELCLECHAEGLVFSRTVHKDRGGCISCHNAHLGKDSRLLKTDYQEAW